MPCFKTLFCRRRVDVELMVFEHRLVKFVRISTLVFKKFSLKYKSSLIRLTSKFAVSLEKILNIFFDENGIS